MKKKCPTCSKVRDSKFFGRNKFRSDGLQSQCKDCKRKTQKNWYEKNKQDHMKRVRLRNKRVREEVAYAIYEYLSKNPCVDCGESDPIVLEFDHVTGEKSFSIGEYARKAYSIKKVFSEISKCVVRCSNCHRKRTAQQFGYRRFLFASIA